MKKIFLFTIAIIAGTTLFAQSKFGMPPATNLSTELAKPLVMHTEKSWKLNKVNGTNKVDLIVEAVEYTSKGTPLIKGIKVTLLPESSTAGDAIALSSKEFVSYIEKAEYSEVIVVLNQMLAEFKKMDDDDIKATVSYITKGGVEFGFVNTDQKEVGFLSIVLDNAIVSCEYYDIDDFLTDLRDNIDIASKDLYLPENAEKLKKAKKGNQEVKDVIIDDI